MSPVADLPEFQNFWCNEMSAMSDHGVFGWVNISVPADADMIDLNMLSTFFLQVKPLATKNAKEL